MHLRDTIYYGDTDCNGYNTRLWFDTTGFSNHRISLRHDCETVSLLEGNREQRERRVYFRPHCRAVEVLALAGLQLARWRCKVTARLSSQYHRYAFSTLSRSTKCEHEDTSFTSNWPGRGSNLKTNPSVSWAPCSRPTSTLSRLAPDIPYGKITRIYLTVVDRLDIATIPRDADH